MAKPARSDYELTITLKLVAPREGCGLDPANMIAPGMNVVANSLRGLPAGARVRLAYEVPGQSSC